MACHARVTIFSSGVGSTDKGCPKSVVYPKVSVLSYPLVQVRKPSQTRMQLINLELTRSRSV